MGTSSVILRSAVEVAHLGLAELDPEGRFVAVSPAYLSLLNLNESDLLGQHWRVTVHSDDYRRAEQAHELARTAGAGCVEIRRLHPDASILYQSLTVESIRNDEGGLKGYRCLLRDLSSETRRQEEIVQALEAAASGLLMIEAGGQIRFANRAVEKLFGYTRDELLQRPLESLFPERFHAQFQEYRHGFNGNEAEGSMAVRDFWGLRKDGIEIPIRVSANAVDGVDSRLILYTMIDMAERLQCEQELRMAKEVAEAANRAKSDFLARMSHEIRTPMGLIMGMNTLLLDTPLAVKQKQHVEISQRNVRRLLRLINGILDLSKVEAGQLILEAVRFDLNEILEECAATISAGVEEKGLEFEIFTDLHTGRYWVGDPERLQQILLNLTGNSLKFTTQGRIEVRVRPETGPQGATGLRFEVSDTGCGVSDDQIEVIFEAFQQAAGALHRPREGTGLGLSIARTLVEKMGGRIWMEKKPSAGSKFVFTVFPQPSEADRNAASVTFDTPPAAAGTRVLLVEDNPDSVILMQAYLGNLLLSLELAANGVEALAKRQQRDYDVVLMDIQMPVMDGYTATREIRSWEIAQGKRRVPIVALTAHAQSESAAESLATGCDGHLTKPVERKDLIETIAKFAPSQATRSPAVSAATHAPHPAFLPICWLELRKMRDALAALEFVVLQEIGHDCAANAVRQGFADIAALSGDIETCAEALDIDGLREGLERFERGLLAASNAGARWAAAGFEPPKR